MARLAHSEHEKRLNLYRRGLSDTQIAYALGLEVSSIWKWRKSAQLRTHKTFEVSRLANSEHRKRLNMYRLGWSDSHIGKCCGVGHTTLHKWREKHNLPPNFLYGEPRQEVLLGEVAEDRRMRLYRRGCRDPEIGREVGVTSNAIFAWRQRRGLPKNEVERDWQRPPASFVSLDAERGENGYTLHGLIADDAAAEWLEEHGATTW